MPDNAYLLIEEAKQASAKGIHKWLADAGRSKEWTNFSFVGHYIDRVVGELRDGEIIPLECANKLPAMRWWAKFLKNEYHLISREVRMRDNMAYYEETVPMNQYQLESAKWPRDETS